MSIQTLHAFFRRTEVLCFLFVLVASYFTYVHNFSNPQSLFWDENYHIASAQKYLNGIHFMEPHPPLGKMFVALGEYLLDENPVDDQFIGTDYGKHLPPGFSFTGYRLFPTLFGWLTAPVLFLIFLILTRNALWATFLSFFYVFDTALIVHSRAAMLDSTMLFFSATTILFYLLALDAHRRGQVPSNPPARPRVPVPVLLFGISFGLLAATKVLGVALILLLLPMLWTLRKDRRKMFRTLFTFAAGAAVIYLGIWQLHLSITKEVNPVLPDQGYYQASEEYKELLDAGKTNLAVMLRDHLAFLPHYEKGVPRLDMCKSDENGSPWFLWPFGGRTINYRWETADGDLYRYLTLQVNPAVWFLGLLGIILSVIIVGASLLFPGRSKFQNLFHIIVFLSIYVAYMVAIARIDRVMYLYHYFIPLILSFILFGLALQEIRQIGRWVVTDTRRTNILLGCAVLIFAAFQIYRPLAYYEPLSDEQVKRRNVLAIWELHCARCARESMLVVPRGS